MGYLNTEIKIKTDYSDSELKEKIKKELGLTDFQFIVTRKSLDGRNRRDIHWILRVDVVSDEIKNDKEILTPQLIINKKKTDKKVLVVGSGPAGLFATYYLLLSGYDVTLVEQGPEVYQRISDVKKFEKGGELSERSNYAFGEGGAGTFSDGKLTSRTKSIETERQWIFDVFIEHGAPAEIKYLAKPHIGSNILVKVVRNMRNRIIEMGGKIHFDCRLLSLDIKDTKAISAETEIGKIEADFFILATGHSSRESYKLLFDIGAKFTLKTFAIGSRIEHLQEVINKAKWKVESLPGVKAADYALTYNSSPLPVYSFCMCPGGMVVPAPPYKGLNLVNGMSNYKRNYPFANSAIVSAFNLSELLKKELTPQAALEWVYQLENKFFEYVGGNYSAPAVKVEDILKNRTSSNFADTSYPFPLVTADFRELFPKQAYQSMQMALREFNKKIPGFETGTLMGLESRTSSPIQSIRDEGGLLAGFDNIAFVGEGSGFSGGIVSSAADGLKSAINYAVKS